MPKKSFKLIISALIICLLLSIGCSPIVKYASFDNEIRESTTKIDVYSSPDKVEKKYKEIGIITVDDNGWDRDETDLLIELQKKAKAIGANGIILLNSEQKNQGNVPISGILYSVTKRISRAVAIVYIN